MICMAAEASSRIKPRAKSYWPKVVAPDFEWTANRAQASTKPEIDYIHRTAAGAEIYFVANRSSNAVALNCTFRVNGLAPELWDAVSGEHHFARAYAGNGRAHVPAAPFRSVRLDVRCFPRSGGAASVHAARQLARVWDCAQRTFRPVDGPF